MNGFAEIDDQGEIDDGPDLPMLFIRGVVRFLPWMVVLILIGAVGGIAVGLLQPNRYASNAKLLLRMGAREQLTSESLVDFDEHQRAAPPTMADELQMLSDAAIFERVASDLGPGVVLGTTDPKRDGGRLTWAPVRLLHLVQGLVHRGLAGLRSESPEEALRSATKDLRDNTTVSPPPERGSNVILVSSTSRSPELARTIVQALTNAFIDRHREQFSIRALLKKSRSQLEEAGQSRDAAAKAYVDQVSHSGIAVLETQVPRLEAELSSLEGEVFAARLRREEISRLRTSLSNRLEGTPVEVEIQRPAVMIPNEEYETQLSLKRGLLAQKQEMLIQSRPSEEVRRREKEFDNQIAKVDRTLKVTPKVIVQGSEMQENLGHTAMESRIVDLEAEDGALVGKLGLLNSRMETKKARLSELQNQLLTASMSRKDLAAVRDAQETRYAQLQNRLAVLEGLETIDADGEANLRVLQAPTLELERVSPRRLSLLLKGLFFGLLAAISFAILRQHFERRLCYPEVFEHARGVPVLGVVPHLPSLGGLEKRATVGSR